MARHDPVKEQVELIALAARDPHTAGSIEIFRRALRGRQSLPAARAADTSAAHGLQDLIPDLAAGFSYFMADPVKRDPRCSAKTAIAEALDRLEYDVCGLFLEGLRHRQLEAVWGGSVDTAAGVRARCLAALVRLNHPDRYRFLADLLFDHWPEARRGAVQAATYAGGNAGELLLRIKVHLGDEDLSIIGDCFAGLIRIAPESALELVGNHLRSPRPELRELAALALGESHLPKAFGLLRSAILDSSSPAEFKTLALAVGLCRSDEAFELLLELLETCPTPFAGGALEALSLCASDPERKRKAAQIAHARGLVAR